MNGADVAPPTDQEPTMTRVSFTARIASVFAAVAIFAVTMAPLANQAAAIVA